jgi:hypothetical protein
MDLWRRHLPRHANVLWNSYLAETTDLEGLSVLPLFLSCRAAVRAKTSSTAATLQSDPRRRRELQDATREYLASPRAWLAISPMMSSSQRKTRRHCARPTPPGFPHGLPISCNGWPRAFSRIAQWSGSIEVAAHQVDGSGRWTQSTGRKGCFAAATMSSRWR